MNHSVSSEIINNENSESNYALKIAFQTMKERCQQLQNRLTFVEKENVALRLECNHNVSSPLCDNKSTELTTVKKLQEKVDELVKQKSQLTHHLIMVAAENRQLWNRLTKLTQANKSLGNHLTSIRDTLKTHSTIDPDILSLSHKDFSNFKSETVQNNQSSTDIGTKEQSLEEISLKLKNSIFLEKSELEQQYADMMELQGSSPINLQSVGFTYPEDSDLNSPDHLKHYGSRLIRTKEALFVQNEKLKKILKTLEKHKKGKGCKNCLKNIAKKTCQAETQATMNEIIKENNYTQTSLSPTELNEDAFANKNGENSESNTCPLCGDYFNQVPFVVFHEHVLSHFSKECIDEMKKC